MVGIIIHDGYTVPLSLVLKTAVCSCERKEPFFRDVHRDVQKICHSNSGQGVGHIVIPSDREDDAVSILSVAEQVKEDISVLIISNIGRAVIKIPLCTVGDRRAGKAFVDFLIIRDLPVDNQGSALRKKRGKLPERMADIFKVFKEVQMILLYI